MNEKYQQALDIIKHAHPVSSEVKDIEELYPNEIDTLQELVDMIKPLEFVQLESGMQVYDKELKNMCSIVQSQKSKTHKMVEMESGDIKVKLSSYDGDERYFRDRFYRNIWEVE